MITNISLFETCLRKIIFLKVRVSQQQEIVDFVLNLDYHYWRGSLFQDRNTTQHSKITLKIEEYYKARLYNLEGKYDDVNICIANWLMRSSLFLIANHFWNQQILTLFSCRFYFPGTF